MEDMKHNNGLKILTPDGFSDFSGVSMMGTKPIWKMVIEGDNWIECTIDHKFFINGNEERTQLSDIKIGDKVLTSNGYVPVVDIFDTGRVEKVYDVIQVDKNTRYYANGIVSSNCEFVTFEETLINSTILSGLSGIEPMFRTGHIRWYKDINPECTYLVALDPSMGTGGDFAAIQVFELPTMTQVAEWQHNKTRIEDQVSIMRDLTKEIDRKGAYEIYWSVENNSLGEAALVTIRDLGEETFAGSMLHDPVNKTAKRRKGFTTTPRSKQETCAMLKRLVERGTLKINSKGLIAELKTFISAGGTYRAKNGAHDDLVMSLILILRMSDFVATWDDKAQTALRSVDSEEDEDDYDAPMPFSFI